MKTVGIIAEYNPFHSGHLYHIQMAKKQTGAAFCVAAISGDFVQRGGPALYDKYLRTRMALICGADLVVEATGVPVVLQDAFQAVRPGGTIVVGSVYHGSISQFEPLPIMRKELTIVGSKGPAPSVKTDGKSVVVDILEALQEDLKKIITVYEYKDGVKAFEDIASGAVIKPVITFK